MKALGLLAFLPGPESGEKLLTRGPTRAGGNKAEPDMEREWGVYGVGGSELGVGGDGGGEAEGEASLLRDGEADVGGKGGCHGGRSGIGSFLSSHYTGQNDREGEVQQS
jgi:hypothetical protein